MGVYAQPELSLYFLPRAFQAQQTNPAFVQDKVFQLAMPSLALQASHDGFRFSDLIQPIAGSDSFQLDVTGTIDKLSEENQVRVDGRLDWLALAFKVAGLQISLSTSTRFYSHATYPKDLLALAWHGNGAYVGETLQIGPAVQAQAYHEIGGGVALKLKDWISVGGRMKYLIGLADINMPQHDLSLLTTEDFYRLQFGVDYQLRASALDLGNVSDPTQISPELGFQPFTGNHGMALDLGVKLKLGKRLDIAASVVDLGFLSWKDNAKIYQVSGQVEFAGLEASTLMEADSFELDAYVDSLMQDVSITETGFRYTTGLPAQVYLSAHYQLPFNLRVGGVVHATYFQQRFTPTLGLNASIDVLRFLTLGATYSVQQNRFDNLGAHVLIKAGPMVLFATSDHLLSVFKPQQAQLFNGRVGVNWMFGGKG